MPKRSNPFGDCSPLQFKSHIGVKEIDLSCQDNMKLVYDKTRDLLFQGANKQSAAVPPIPPKVNSLNCAGYDFSSFHSHPRCNGVQQHANGLTNGHHQTQTNGHPNGQIEQNSMDIGGENGCLASNCASFTEGNMGQSSSDILPGQMQLDSSGHLAGFFTKKSLDTTTGGASSSQPSCAMCQRKVQQLTTRCHFCDKYLCTSCVQQCNVCSGDFCSFCSIVNYDNNFERSFCLNCASS